MIELLESRSFAKVDGPDTALERCPALTKPQRICAVADTPTTPKDRARSITQTEARRRFDYDGATGNLIWLPATDRQRKWNSKMAGKVAGCNALKSGGKRYVVIGFGDGLVRAHHIVWAWHHGPLATGLEIDHIDGNGLNNRIENLRAVTATENKRNLRRNATNTSGVMGVRWVPERQKYAAYCRENGKVRPLGRYATFNEAVAVRKAWEQANGYHENHGQDRPL